MPKVPKGYPSDYEDDELKVVNKVMTFHPHFTYPSSNTHPPSRRTLH